LPGDVQSSLWKYPISSGHVLVKIAHNLSLTLKDLQMIIGQLLEPSFLADSILPWHSFLLHGFIIKPLVKEKL
jgi:hypothetical protein